MTFRAISKYSESHQLRYGYVRQPPLADRDVLEAGVLHQRVELLLGRLRLRVVDLVALLPPDRPLKQFLSLNKRYFIWNQIHVLLRALFIKSKPSPIPSSIKQQILQFYSIFF